MSNNQKGSDDKAVKRMSDLRKPPKKGRRELNKALVSILNTPSAYIGKV